MQQIKLSYTEVFNNIVHVLVASAGEVNEDGAEFLHHMRQQHRHGETVGNAVHRPPRV